MKTIYCELIKDDGKRCNRERRVKKWAYRTKYCQECADLIAKKKSSDYYQKNKKRLRKLANAASKRRPSKSGQFASSTKLTECICPKCEEISYMRLFLYDPEKKYETKPYPKYCDPCNKALLGHDCPDAGAYGVGY